MALKKDLAMQDLLQNAGSQCHKQGTGLTRIAFPSPPQDANGTSRASTKMQEDLLIEKGRGS
jgi:hypothetical protein